MIVAFPDVDPSVILISDASNDVNEHNFSRHLSEKALLLRGATNEFDKPHLWYSTADVIYALELFLANGDEVSDSDTFR